MSCNRCNRQAAAAMAAAGVPEHQTNQATWSTVHQHLPRCGHCGRWMSPGNPQCGNAACRMREAEARRAAFRSRFAAAEAQWVAQREAPAEAYTDDPLPADMPTCAEQIEPDSDAAQWVARREAEAAVIDARERQAMDEAMEAYHQLSLSRGIPASLCNDDVWEAAQEHVEQTSYEYQYENVLGGAPVTFGVEIECVPDTSIDSEFPRRVADRLRAEGLTTQDRVEKHHKGAQHNEHTWGIEDDKSLTYGGVEVISPILSDSPEHWRQLERVCAIIQEEGGMVNRSCGGHVHVGVSQTLDTDPPRWRRLARVYGAFQDVIYRMSANGERHRGAGMGYRYSRPLGNRETLRPRNFDSMRDVESFFESTCRGGLNYQHSRDHRVEFRQFDGSVDASRIQQNVRLSTGMVMSSAETISTQLPDPQRLGQHHRQESSDDSSVRHFLDTVFQGARTEDKLAALRLYRQGDWQPAN
jgi:hypothetical protein